MSVDVQTCELAPKRKSSMYGESGYERRANDAYYTQHWVTRGLCDVVRFRGKITECAAGRGDIAIVLRERGYDVIAGDIAPAGPGIDAVDFLKETIAPPSVQSIVTNPPYGEVGAEFARHALNLMLPVRGMVALLARQEWDSAATRRDIFDEHPAFALKITLTTRPLWDWWGEQRPGKKAQPRHNFAWFVWDWAHRGPAQIAYAPVRRDRGN